VGEVRGWRIEPLNAQRQWMQDTENHAYKCLPLTMANQWGWAIFAPCGTAGVWNGKPKPGNIHFMEPKPSYALDHFGYGVLTHSLPWVFRTPKGWDTLVTPCPNSPEMNLQGLWGIVETSWLAFTFTYNRRIIRPHEPFELRKHQPVCTIRPIQTAELERFKLEQVDDPEMVREYKEFAASRREYNNDKTRGPKDFQGLYHRGANVGCPHAGKGQHRTKLKLERMGTGDDKENRDDA
jgi:hypothetical protein